MRNSSIVDWRLWCSPLIRWLTRTRQGRLSIHAVTAPRAEPQLRRASPSRVCRRSSRPCSRQRRTQSNAGGVLRCSCFWPSSSSSSCCAAGSSSRPVSASPPSLRHRHRIGSVASEPLFDRSPLPSPRRCAALAAACSPTMRFPLSSPRLPDVRSGPAGAGFLSSTAEAVGVQERSSACNVAL